MRSIAIHIFRPCKACGTGRRVGCGGHHLCRSLIAVHLAGQRIDEAITTDLLTRMLWWLTHLSAGAMGRLSQT